MATKKTSTNAKAIDAFMKKEFSCGQTILNRYAIDNLEYEGDKFSDVAMQSLCRKVEKKMREKLGLEPLPTGKFYYINAAGERKKKILAIMKHIYNDSAILEGKSDNDIINDYIDMVNAFRKKKNHDGVTYVKSYDLNNRKTYLAWELEVTNALIDAGKTSEKDKEVEPQFKSEEEHNDDDD